MLKFVLPKYCPKILILPKFLRLGWAISICPLAGTAMSLQHLLQLSVYFELFLDCRQMFQTEKNTCQTEKIKDEVFFFKHWFIPMVDSLSKLNCIKQFLHFQMVAYVNYHPGRKETLLVILGGQRPN